jgi:enamine deaminase RidA (YjgF/YER057c/UK114 family)
VVAKSREFDGAAGRAATIHHRRAPPVSPDAASARPDGRVVGRHGGITNGDRLMSKPSTISEKTSDDDKFVCPTQRGRMNVMSHQALLPEGWPRPPGFSHGIDAAPGRTVFVAGQIGREPGGDVASDFAGQFEKALANVVAVVATAGGRADHICRLTMFCTDKAAYLAATSDFGDIWRRVMGKHFPTISLLFVSDLVDSAAKIEMEAVAVIPED